MGYQMVAQVNIPIDDTKVEVVAGAEIGCRHYQVVSFSAYHNPYCPVARLEYILLNTFSLNCFEGFCEALAKCSEKFATIVICNSFRFRYFSADSQKGSKF